MSTSILRMFVALAFVASTAQAAGGRPVVESIQRRVETRTKEVLVQQGKARESAISEEVTKARTKGQISSDATLTIKNKLNISEVGDVAELTLRAGLTAQETMEAPKSSDAETTTKVQYINLGAKAILSIIGRMSDVTQAQIDTALSTAVEKRNEEQHGIVGNISSLKTARKFQDNLDKMNETELLANSYALHKFDKNAGKAQESAGKREAMTSSKASYSSGKLLFEESQQLQKQIESGNLSGRELENAKAKLAAIKKLLKDLFDCV